MIKIVGGLYLLWLALRAFRAAFSTPGSERSGVVRSSRECHDYYLRGLFIQITNPKAAFTWIAIISLGLQADSSFGFVAAVVSGTTILAAGVHCIYAIAFSTDVAVRGYNKARRWIETGMGMFFTLAGIKLLGSEIQTTSALQG